MLRYLVILLISASFAFGGIIDNFDRADSPAGLGPNWINLGVGDARILGGQALAARAVATHPIPVVVVEYAGLTANTIYADVTAGANVGYVALVMGISGTSCGAASDYFIKVQSTDGNFTSYGFYCGNNQISPGNSGPFSDLDAPFTSGRIQASLSGRTATLTITPVGGGAVQTYSHTYSADPLGNGVGLGFFGLSSADNFGANVDSAVPEPASFGLLLAGAGALALFRRRRSSGVSR